MGHNKMYSTTALVADEIEIDNLQGQKLTLLGMCQGSGTLIQ